MAERTDPFSDASHDIRTDALETLGHDIRIRILRALADADEPLTFTELRETVDVRDTGRFNYHLTKLCEYFVRETSGGYELGHAGTRIVAASHTADIDRECQQVEECPVCGETGCEKLFHVHLNSPSIPGF